jgi:alkanesulfonate monooxygenase SsuD/methylene tetrahydromethanopterin reductase-like flavin-dependent oxidoreductase (luciferase family)
VKVGFRTAPQKTTWAEMEKVWRWADTAGFDSGWLWDHIIALHGNLDDDHFEGWTALAALGAVTENLQLGHIVTANTLRHPALLAKMAATVDHVTDGRLVVGIGTGYYAEEHDRYGIPLPDKVTRAAMLLESIEVLKGLWAPGRLTFAGEHYRITDAPASPKPVNGDIPLLLGGAGERMLKATARWADLWNLPDGQYGIDEERFTRKLATVRANCEEIGRDPAEIEMQFALVVICDPDPREVERRFEAWRAYRRWDEATALRHAIIGSPEQVAGQLLRWEELGLQHFVISVVHGTNHDQLERIAAEVLPHVRS